MSGATLPTSLCTHRALDSALRHHSFPKDDLSISGKPDPRHMLNRLPKLPTLSTEQKLFWKQWQTPICLGLIGITALDVRNSHVYRQITFTLLASRWGSQLGLPGNDVQLMHDKGVWSFSHWKKHENNTHCK